MEEVVKGMMMVVIIIIIAPVIVRLGYEFDVEAWKLVEGGWWVPHLPH